MLHCACLSPLVGLTVYFMISVAVFSFIFASLFPSLKLSTLGFWQFGRLLSLQLLSLSFFFIFLFLKVIILMLLNRRKIHYSLHRPFSQLFIISPCSLWISISSPFLTPSSKIILPLVLSLMSLFLDSTFLIFVPLPNPYSMTWLCWLHNFLWLVYSSSFDSRRYI